MAWHRTGNWPWSEPVMAYFTDVYRYHSAYLKLKLDYFKLKFEVGLKEISVKSTHKTWLPIWIMSSDEHNIFKIINRQKTLTENMSNFAVSTASADDLALIYQWSWKLRILSPLNHSNGLTDLNLLIFLWTKWWQNYRFGGTNLVSETVQW